MCAQSYLASPASVFGSSLCLEKDQKIVDMEFSSSLFAVVGTFADVRRGIQGLFGVGGKRSHQFLIAHFGSGKRGVTLACPTPVITDDREEPVIFAE